MTLRTKIKVVAMSITVVSTVTMSIVDYTQHHSALRESINARVREIAVTLAVAVHPTAVASITGPESLDTPEYCELEQLVRTVTAANQVGKFPLRFVYLLVPTKANATSGWDFAVDSDPRSSADWTAPGTPYNYSPSTIAIAPIESANPSVRELDDEWGNWLSGYAPIRASDGRVVGLVGVDVSYESYLAQLDWLLWWASGLALLLSLVMCVAVDIAVNLLFRPIRQLREFIGHIGAGQFDQRLEAMPRGEFRTVIDDLNSMAVKLSDRAQLARRNLELTEDVSRKQDHLTAFADVDAQLHEIQDLDILMEAILADARRLVVCDAGSVMLREGNDLLLTYLQNDTLEAKSPDRTRSIARATRIPVSGGSVAGYAALSGQPVLIDDAYGIPAGRPYQFNPEVDRATGYRTRAVLAHPLRTSAGKIIGVLQLLNPLGKDGNARAGFSADDAAAVAHFAMAATVALERAALTRSIVLRMIRMAEMRDPSETAAHVNRVAAYSVIIYEGLARKHRFVAARIQRERDSLRIAAMLHDVGKVGIPDAILKKAGRLTAEEYSGMQKHAEIGARLFADRESVLDKYAFEVALHHHERWDGNGYPGMLSFSTEGSHAVISNPAETHEMKGEGIPLFARIVSVADVFDALSSKRQYKEAWPEDRVINEMRVNAGRQFDPELVEILIENMTQIRAVAARYASP